MNKQYLMAAKAYGNVGINTGVATADPHHLIVMLFDGAISALRNAQLHIRAQRTAEKGMEITKAIRILEEGLKASLDHKAGGEIATHLAALYDFMTRHLLSANKDNNVVAIAEVLGILQGLRDSWIAIDPHGNPPAGPKGAWSLPAQLAAAA
jgi:flagellar protein FliS